MHAESRVFQRLSVYLLAMKINGGTSMRLLQSTDRRVGMLGAVLCLACLGYFYLLDRQIFSSAGFTVIFQSLLIYYDVYAAWVSAAICLVAAFIVRPNWILRVVDGIGARPVQIAVATTVAIAGGAVFIYRDYPLCMDEYAAVFQSKIFASGHLYAMLPRDLLNWLVVPGFNGSFLVSSPETGRTIEGYWPGFAMLLAPFQFLNVPWLCNASLSGLALFLSHRITLDVTGDRRAAGWSVLFMLASSVFWAYGISYYSMQAHMTLNLLFAWLLLQVNGWRAFAAGAVGSLALILHNPFPHVLFAAPWVATLLTTRELRKSIPPLIAGYIPGLVIGCAWSLLRSNIVPVTPGAESFGDALNSIFSWPDSDVLNMRAASIAKLWVWAVPCLIVFAVLGGVRYRSSRHARNLALSAVFTLCGYFFVKLDQGHGWGYRYFHSAWGMVPILAGCGMSRRPDPSPQFTSFAGTTAIFSLLILVPFQLSQISEIIGKHLALVPAPLRPGNNLYFIQPTSNLYIADAIQIDPYLRSQDLILASRGADLDAALVRQNWPDAVRLRGELYVEHWYLGPVERRVLMGGSTVDRQFKIQYRPMSGSLHDPGGGIAR